MTNTRFSVGPEHASFKSYNGQKLSSIEFSKISASSKISKKNLQGFFLYKCQSRNKTIPASKNVPMSHCLVCYIKLVINYLN
jgi:hypothetical protein